eukprot:TRINITY_DN29869_c0_g1_i1.p1 TRINITY_DN29869_c0_g1~~TRINITY_DN29869_c0_g1_i1.p1  ORF type:complete len:321 (-),score=57.23 TRINITY_DN29869_c0_g1_i1:239-1087(-)
MGLPMAINLQKGMSETNSRLHVWNRTSSKATAVLELGALLEPSVSSLAEHCDIIFSMCFDDDALESIFETVLEKCTKKKILVSFSTVTPGLVQRLAERSNGTNLELLSAPVFGRPDAAASRTLICVLAGPESAKSLVLPYLSHIVHRVDDLGEDTKSANVMKLIGNFVLASSIDMIAQVQTLGEKNGIPRHKTTELLKFFCNSPILPMYAKRMADDNFEPGFTVIGGLKDATLMRTLAMESGVSLPFIDIVMGHLNQQISRGDGELDWSSLVKSVRSDSNLI